MSDSPPRSQLAALSQPVANTVSRTVPLIRAAVLLVSIAAAIPTANNLYYSWKHGVPFNQVSHRLNQYDLWMKNLDCKIDYRQLLTAAGSKVDVGACPKSGDIAIKVSAGAGQATYEWIAFNQLQKPAAASLFGLVLPSANAAGAPAPSIPGSFQLAQGGMVVQCQAPQSNATLIRVVQDGGKCYREVLSMIKGSVEKREEVPCTTQCK